MPRFKYKGVTIIQAVALIVTGVAACYMPWVVTAVWGGVFLATLAAMIKGRQDWVWYCIAASPMLEVWSRMVRGAVMVDEIGKYYLLLAIVGLFIYQQKNGRQKPLFKVGELLLILIIPSLIVNVASFDREQWVFNILSLLELGALLMLVARERWDVERFAKTIQYGVMPIVFVVAYMIYKSPSLAGVNFTLGANFKTAAGGTNQVATVLGLGILFTMLLLFLKRPVVSIKWISYLLIGYLFFRSFLTFSRGGVFAAIACVLVVVGFAMTANRKTFIRYSAIMIAFLVVGLLVFQKVDDLTNHMLTQRYRGETVATATGRQEKTWNKVTSGRSSLIQADWIIFKQYPLFGVGPGGAKDLRSLYGAPADSAAHTEVTRLLSEHGIGGALAALVLILFPLYWLSKQRYRLWMGVNGALFCMAILTSSHSATRTNTMAVCYALASIPVFVIAKKKRGQQA